MCISTLPLVGARTVCECVLDAPVHIFLLQQFNPYRASTRIEQDIVEHVEAIN